MSYKTIMLNTDNGIATITLNRPDKLNALDAPMAQEFLDVLRHINSDSTLRVLTITGAGEAFSAGADIDGLFLKWNTDPAEGEENRAELDWIVSGKWAKEACLALRELSIPTIASVNGAAVGWGCTLSLACDLRIAADDSRLGMVFSRVGYMPEFGSTYLLPRLVGVAKACELVFCGKIIDAYEAEKIGLVNRIVPAAKLISATNELAQTIARQAPISLELAKTALYQGLDSTLVAQLHTEQLAAERLTKTADFAEGLRAFVEKRPAVFQGK